MPTHCSNGKIENHVNEETPILLAFLEFPYEDRRRNPQNILPFPPALLSRMLDFTADIDIDLDAPLEGDDDSFLFEKLLFTMQSIDLAPA